MNLTELLSVDDCLVVSLKIPVMMAHLADIDLVGQQVIDFAAGPFRSIGLAGTLDLRTVHLVGERKD